jgi:hypothetical protein
MYRLSLASGELHCTMPSYDVTKNTHYIIIRSTICTFEHNVGLLCRKLLPIVELVLMAVRHETIDAINYFLSEQLMHFRGREQCKSNEIILVGGRLGIAWHADLGSERFPRPYQFSPIGPHNNT